ncbi:MAG TPA: GNAT family N-acetyltransferase [Gaiellaceae bacterium]|jgi:GNAT superfamily N-acetyltransferase|nr:GNAT family N-acetyltransferase [Gaiellaceae bacterium]
MQVREIDPPSAPVELVDALYALEVEAAGEMIPLEPARAHDVAVAFWRTPPSDQKRRHWIAEVDGQVVGMAGLYVYGPAFVLAEVFVTSAHRRRGVGTAMLEAICAAAREAEITSFFADHATEGGAAFAAHHEAVDDQREVRSLLRLREAELPEPSLPDGHTLRSWIGSCPDELVDSYAVARAAMSDAPAPGGAELDDATVDSVRRAEETALRRGREIRVTVALDPTGSIVSFTDVRVTPGDTTVNTDDSGTVAHARGRGLARAVKLESLRRLRQDRPEVEIVITMNAEQNAAMRHINTTIGFVPTATLTATVLTL